MAVPIPVMQLGGPAPRTPQVGYSPAQSSTEFESPRPPPTYVPRSSSRSRPTTPSSIRGRSAERDRSRSRSRGRTGARGRTAPPTPQMIQTPHLYKPSPRIGYAQHYQQHYNSPPPMIKPISTKQKTDWWAWEMSALLTSLLAIGGIVVLLLHFDGKPIPIWSLAEGGGLSVNTILSVLSTLSRTSLLIPLDDCLGQLMWVRLARRRRRPARERDSSLTPTGTLSMYLKSKARFSEEASEDKGRGEPSTKLGEIEDFGMASQGVWGCLKLLWRHRGRSLASMGCLLTVFSLGLGPATQQLLSYPTRMIVNKASISTVTYATSYERTGPTGGSGVLGDIVMALYTGGSTSPSEKLIPNYSCDSGSCTFRRFTTLGICSECHVIDPPVPCELIPDGRGMCRSSYLNGAVTASRRRGDPEQERYITLFNQTVIPPDGSQRLEHLSTEDQWSVGTVANLHLSPANDDGAVAMECALVWCVKQVDAVVTQGVYTETVERVDTMRAYSRQVLNGGQELLITRTDEFDDTDLSPPPPMSESARRQGFVQPKPFFPTEYRVSREAHDEMKLLVEEKLTGWVERNGTQQNPVRTSSDLMHVLSEGIKSGGEVFEGFAIALTNLVRNRASTAAEQADIVVNDGENTSVITGQTWIPQAFIRANWFWIIYPGVMWLFSAGFLGSVVIVSHSAKRRLGVPVWGGSWLAMGLVGVDEAVKNRAKEMASRVGDVGGVLDREGMRRLGEEVRVRLSVGGGVEEGVGLRLRLVERKWRRGEA